MFIWLHQLSSGSWDGALFHQLPVCYFCYIIYLPVLGTVPFCHFPAFDTFCTFCILQTSGLSFCCFIFMVLDLSADGFDFLLVLPFLCFIYILHLTYISFALSNTSIIFRFLGRCPFVTIYIINLLHVYLVTSVIFRFLGRCPFSSVASLLLLLHHLSSGSWDGALLSLSCF